MRNIAIEAEKAGIEAYTSCQYGISTRNEPYQKHLYIGTRLGRNIHLKLGEFTGRYGLFSAYDTKKFIKQIDQLNPDIVHLHNLHKGYINLNRLFRYLKEKNKPVVWTLHDCWSFTGQCPYFDRVQCQKWRTGCGHCPQYKDYPSKVDGTASMFQKKKQWFTGLRNMTIVTPSQWLAELVAESYLKDYKVKIIHNGIDLSVFRPRKTNLREKLKLGNKTVILGVASIWDSRKGLEVFEELSGQLSDDYQIILIGLNSKQLEAIPKNIIGIARTTDANELAEYYSMADIFVNPTVEDNFPTVNLEALACGTPVFTFPTGGSTECIENGCGKIVTRQSLASDVTQLKTFEMNRNRCIEVSKQYAMQDKFREYIELYRKILVKL
ncbi:glycosyltransferase [Diplocloster agilis]|uniref:glycosyltransferase n=1 Tax=Diplocloster agilis TaxID=2850323 RepID=UPI00082261B0|nr:glycosyltransferase [Suonthocola fibrivorans]MCU6733121.1 glycosyltransferase [Suonthocola fibrivorans]SCI76086.1 Spore coat protein SA [uncultured Clostridium sp.]